jgi:hypothetical protein
MVEVQTWNPYKTIQCANNLGFPMVCFHLILNLWIVVIFYHIEMFFAKKTKYEKNHNNFILQICR